MKCFQEKSETGHETRSAATTGQKSGKRRSGRDPHVCHGLHGAGRTAWRGAPRRDALSRKKLTLCHGTSHDGFSKQIVISNSRESRRNCRRASRRRTDIRFSIFVNRCISPNYFSHIPKTTVLYAEKGGKTFQNSQSCSLILTILQSHLDYLAASLWLSWHRKTAVSPCRTQEIVVSERKVRINEC